jgi:DNA polymerase-3 subunit epsilon
MGPGFFLFSRKTRMMIKKTVRKKNPEFLQFARFAAIDFETADYGRDSACAVAVVVVDCGKIIYRGSSLIKPPRRNFVFTYIHGITWEDVVNQPDFREFWPKLSPLFKGVDFVAAHNASFDRSVLRACCADANVSAPEVKFLCTMKLARRLWNLYPTKLPDVCGYLNIPLKHHDAASDALACASIVLETMEHGIPVSALLKETR